MNFCVKGYAGLGFLSIMALAGCGGGGGGNSLAISPPPTANILTSSTLHIPAGQTIYGQFDQNNGTVSYVGPYLLVATGGNVGPGGYTWTVPTGVSVPFPSLIIQPFGVVYDTSKLIPSGIYTLPVEVSDGTNTVTSNVQIDTTTICNSISSVANGVPSTPCATPILTNVHNPYLPNGTVGTPYAATIVTSGGIPPYTWKLESGNLPPGLTIDAGKGIISGTPTAAGPYQFYVLTTDHAGSTTAPEYKVLAAQFSLTVN